MVNKFPHGDFKCNRCKDRNYIVQCKCSPNCTETFPRVDKFGILREFAFGHAVRVREQSGEKNPSWKGGQSFNKVTGYWTSLAPNHPFAWENGRVPTHRLIYEKYLSELAGEEVYIPPELDVHHKNEIKTDNRIENLEVLEHGDHTMGHNFVDMSKRRCSYPGCKTPTETGIDKENGRPHWINNVHEKGKHWCTRCADKHYRNTMITCLICHEQRKKYKKDICERCWNRKISENSPMLKCKTDGCNTQFRELDTNGKKREYCRSCRLSAKRSERFGK